MSTTKTPVPSGYYDPADYTMVHNTHLATLQRGFRRMAVMQQGDPLMKYLRHIDGCAFSDAEREKRHDQPRAERDTDPACSCGLSRLLADR